MSYRPIPNGDVVQALLTEATMDETEILELALNALRRPSTNPITLIGVIGQIARIAQRNQARLQEMERLRKAGSQRTVSAKARWERERKQQED